jgi:phospholipid/cholesterol/gamma-HCH transport system substrate-binding protein
VAKAFKFRHVNEIAGGFVLAGGALLVGAVVMMGVSQGWFVPTRHFTVELPETGTAGLRPGADVQVLGNVVGSVDRIQPDPQNPDRLQADLAIKGDFRNYIRDTSRVSIKRTLGFGDAYVEISKGTGSPRPPGDTIPMDERNPVEQPATAMLESTVADIRKEVVPALQEARGTFAEYKQLAADLRRPDGPLQQALGHVNTVAAKVEQGEGLAGKLLSDPQMAADAQRTLASVNKSLEELQAVVQDVHKTTAVVAGQTDETLRRTRAILTDIEKTTATLPETTKSINRTAEALPGLVLQLQETLRQVQRTVEGLQRSFLVRGSVAPDETPGRIRPEDVGAGGR